MPTKTELIWDGKYDAKGNRVAALRVALPFQTIETVNESVQDRSRSLFQLAEQEKPWRNRLIWGDKKYVLPSLLPEFARKVNLIYIDPPFDTGADFSFTASVPDADEEDSDAIAFTKEPSIIEQKAYRDTWGRGIDSYLQWFYETVVLLHELLAETGCIYVHLDWHVGHYARAILDEVFGPENFINEIVWRRKQASAWLSKQFGITNDTLFYYSKSPDYVFNPEFSKEDANTRQYIQERFTCDDGDGRKYRKSPLVNPLNRPNLQYRFHGVESPPLGWLYSKERMEEMFQNNELVMPKENKGRIYRKIYEDTYPGQVIQNIWTDIPIVNPMAKERLDFPTQKPEALLQRIIKASSNEGDLILDCFAGSGTTAAVAEKLNRRWIACDLGRFAIHTTRKRLLCIEGVRPFVVQNLGKYERQLWQTGQFAKDGPETPGQADQRHRGYVEFILKLYSATPISGRTWLHGVKGGRMVHVGGVEAPVTVGDVKQIAVEFKKAMGTGKDAPTTNGVDVLGWDFAFELNEVAKQQAHDANILMAFKRIPRDVMDKRAVEQGEIKFFELAALSVGVKTKGQKVTLTLSDFVIPPDDVPEDVRQAVKHWSQWIDYWAVDWDNKSDTFHNQWQAFRTRKDNKLPLETAHEYAEAGEYRIVVKVIDILGNDTTKTVKVKAK